jgi:small-conductance mechanosensitive channel
MVGLFAAAFGLGARPLVSDYLTGVGFLFEDTFDVGEKVDILGNEGGGGNGEPAHHHAALAQRGAVCGA